MKKQDKKLNTEIHFFISLGKLCRLTNRHGGGSRCSAMMCKLVSRGAADHCVHAAPAGNITPGEGQLSDTLFQGHLKALALHLLHPESLLTDLCPQPGKKVK